jgi:hypothetical protein
VVPGQLIGTQRPTATPDPPTGWAPPGAMPSKDALTYWKEAITVLLLFLALPWLVYKLMTDPGRVLTGAGRKHVA